MHIKVIKCTSRWSNAHQGDQMNIKVIKWTSMHIKVIKWTSRWSMHIKAIKCYVSSSSCKCYTQYIYNTTPAINTVSLYTDPTEYIETYTSYHSWTMSVDLKYMHVTGQGYGWHCIVKVIGILNGASVKHLICGNGSEWLSERRCGEHAPPHHTQGLD